jgi:hypothetical protein
MAVRRMLIVAADLGLVEVEVRNDKTASTIGRHHAAIGHYLATGDDSPLAPFRKVRLRIGSHTYRPETDPAAIEDLALVGDLGYDDIYALE